MTMYELLISLYFKCVDIFVLPFSRIVVKPVQEGHGEEKVSVFPPFDVQYFPSQIFWLVLSFSVLLILLWRVFLPRIYDTMETRQSRIADDLAEARQMQTKAEGEKRDHDHYLKEARQQAQAVDAQTRSAIIAKIESEMQKADSAYEQAFERVVDNIAKERQEVLANIDMIAKESALGILNKLMAGRFSAQSLSKK